MNLTEKIKKAHLLKRKDGRLTSKEIMLRNEILFTDLPNLQAENKMLRETSGITIKIMMCDEPLQMIDEPCPVCTGKVIAQLQAENKRLEGEIKKLKKDMKDAGLLTEEEFNKWFAVRIVKRHMAEQALKDTDTNSNTTSKSIEK